jgi:hypothetical protein
MCISICVCIVFLKKTKSRSTTELCCVHITDVNLSKQISYDNNVIVIRS